MINTNYCVIMAGGVGSRFWPLSRQSNPKQFLDILNTGKSFIRSTFERFLPIVPRENFYVVTSRDYLDQVLEHLPELSAKQVLCEPLRRNTAPCIAYATYCIRKECPDANIVVTPSDHLVLDPVEFRNIMTQGLEFAKNNNALITVGIKPSRPETGYGYIQIDRNGKIGEFDKVKTFTEKPNLELAEAFLASGEFFWNSGIFIWSVNSIINALDKHLPELNSRFAEGDQYYGTDNEQEFIDNLYSKCESISIDYGIMEKAENVFVRQADFGWSDIGTWGSLYDHMPKDDNHNSIRGDKTLLYNTTNSIVSSSEKKMVVIDGLDGFLVVDTEDNLLICPLENEQSIRNYVDDIKYKFGKEHI